MMKLLLIPCLLASSVLMFAGPKDYELLLPSTVRAGSVILAPGQYRLRVEGGSAIFTNVRNNETFAVPVHIDNVCQSKADEMNVRIGLKKQAGVQRIESIQLVDVHSTLEF